MLKMLRHIKIVIVMLGLLLLTGCWDVQEIRNRAIVNAVFFDIKKPNQLIIGVATNIPGTLAPTNVGTYQQFNKRNILITGEGDSMVKAWTDVLANTSRDIFFGQTRAVILSEQIARENINDYLDFIGRIPLVPPNTNVLVAKEDPKKLLDMKNLVNELPGNYINMYFQNPIKRSLAIPVDLWRVNAIMDRKTDDPYIPLFEESQKNFKIAGTAVFSENRMVGQLNMDETETLALIRGTDDGNLVVPLANREIAAFKNVRSSTKIIPKISADGKLTFSVRTKISGNLVENLPHREILMKQKKQIERQAKIMTQRKIRNLITKLQHLNSDPVGFGEQLRIKYPRQWKKVNWHRLYSTAEFNVGTKFSVGATGLFR